MYSWGIFPYHLTQWGIFPHNHLKFHDNFETQKAVCKKDFSNHQSIRQ